MLETSKTMITVDIHVHLDCLNSSIDKSEDVDILQERVEKIKKKQQEIEAVVSLLKIMIDPPEQSNCSRKCSRLKIEIQKGNVYFQNIRQRGITDNYWWENQPQCSCHQMS